MFQQMFVMVPQVYNEFRKYIEINIQLQNI